MRSACASAWSYAHVRNIRSFRWEIATVSCHSLHMGRVYFIWRPHLNVFYSPSTSTRVSTRPELSHAFNFKARARSGSGIGRGPRGCVWGVYRPVSDVLRKRTRAQTTSHMYNGNFSFLPKSFCYFLYIFYYKNLIYISHKFSTQRCLTCIIYFHFYSPVILLFFVVISKLPLTFSNKTSKTSRDLLTRIRE